MRRTLAVLGILALSPSAFALVTTESLLNDMADLKRLAEFPKPAYTCKQFSSYDRASTGPDHPETWFANADAGQFLRVEKKGERKEWVMADTEGPGTIVRIWSANPIGTIRIYLDNDDKPTIECPMDQLLGGKYPGLPRPIAGEYSKGWNLYFPIPYAGHLKVTGDKKDFYYHVNYRTYAKGTPVQTFRQADLKGLSTQIERVAARLDHPKSAAEPPADSRRIEFSADLAMDEEKELATIDSDPRQPENAIAGLRFELTAPHLAAAARGVVLSIEFDREKAVECPVGDFFGMAPGFMRYESLPLGVADDGPRYGWSHWWMPFQSRAILTVRNWSGQPVSVRGAAALSSFAWDDRSLLFHAKWRIQRDIPTRPFIDWTHLDTEGMGRFVGGHLHFINPVKAWWGEGDEKIYVDGEKFPSTFGTGTEDYYGYAWGNADPFMHAYHNQTHVDGPDTYGNVSDNRWHLFDDIPFTTHFKFDMEQWAWDEKHPVTRAAVTYWYARPGGRDTFKAISQDDVRYIPVPLYQVHQVAGAIEGESLSVVEKTGGEVHPEAANESFSGERVLRWAGSKPGDKLTLAFDSPSTGSKHVFVHLVRSNSAQTVQVYVNGNKAGPISDLFGPRGSPSLKLDLGEHQLKEGLNQLSIEIVGRNEKAKGTPAIGIDYLLIQ